jgi:hypothetical protein
VRGRPTDVSGSRGSSGAVASRAPRAWAASVVPLLLATAALAGGAVAVVPQHAASILRLAAATALACVGLVVVAELLRADVEASAPTRAPSPLDRPPAPPLRAMEPPGLAAARRTLHQAAAGPGLQPTRQQLVDAATAVLDAHDR